MVREAGVKGNSSTHTRIRQITHKNQHYTRVKAIKIINFILFIYRLSLIDKFI